MKKLHIVYTLVLALAAQVAMAQTKPWSQRMAATAMTLWKDSLNGNWTYDHGVIMKGIERVWEQTGDPQYFKYVQHNIDKFVTADGNILKYKQADYNIDNVLNGRNVLTLFNVLGTAKYYKAATILREQLKNQPRIPEGGFWHKKRYPNQMWLDGLYMGEPFYAEYAKIFHEDTAFNDIAKQFILMEQHARNPKTGLLYHAWDQSKEQKWADKKTGLSPNFWGRAMGWYGMALVDVLDHFPKNHPKRPEIIAILNRLAAGIQKYQDAKTGVWYQVVDKGGKAGNYLEASASCMFVYTLAKGVREGYLPAKFRAVADKGYQGVLTQFVSTDANGQVNLNKVCSVAGLGGNPYRDGSYEYYLSEKVVTNDPKGVGAFIQAAVEMERLQGLGIATGKTVMLDSYFNNEHRKDVTGANVSYHYKWDEKSNNGFYFFGHLFENEGFNTATLYDAPTASNLKKADVYVIVDPDIPKENPDAKYIEDAHIKAISEWVNAGGVLVVLHNDTGNAEFKHLNNLMAKFGMHFNENSVNKVQGQQFEQGGITIPVGNSIFKTAKKIYIKEISTLDVKAPAKPALTAANNVIVATAKYGKGTVFAVGDPWFYDEYTDGRKLPADFENYGAAKDLVKWIGTQLPAKR